MLQVFDAAGPKLIMGQPERLDEKVSKDPVRA
jgi:hypothetical protein